MDKFDAAAKILLDKTDEHERADLKIVLTVVGDTMRGIEQIGADIDRIATALEKLAGI